MVHRTVSLALDSADNVTVVTANREVARMARSLGARIHLDPGGGLSRAVGSAVDSKSGPWAVFHSDLPLLTASEVTTVVGLPPGGVLVPSPDGGTPVMGGVRHGFPFSYGPGSFHRHLRLLPEAHILTSVGLALDIDGPSDLIAALSHPRGAWLEEVVGAISGRSGIA